MKLNRKEYGSRIRNHRKSDGWLYVLPRSKHPPSDLIGGLPVDERVNDIMIKITEAYANL